MFKYCVFILRNSHVDNVSNLPVGLLKKIHLILSNMTGFYFMEGWRNIMSKVFKIIADRSAYHVSKMEIEFPSVPPQEIVVSYR